MQTAQTQTTLPPINRHTVEHVYARGLRAQRTQDNEYANKGMRAAQAKSRTLLLALERGTEILHQIAEEQYGRSIRDGSLTHRPVWPTELSLWREAYIAADRGEPMKQFCWIYGMAAELAGL
jgi:hypothetical protein